MSFGRTTQYGTYVDRHFAAGVLPDAARWTTTHAATVHAADRHARTGGPGGWRGSEFNVLRR